jgi:hypothetical protein
LERSFDRLNAAQDRNESIRMCTWPRFPHNTRQFYGILRRTWHSDQFVLVLRVHDVIQSADGKYRLDIWIDDLTNEADQIVNTLLEQLPHRWHTRVQIPYHLRIARQTGRSFPSPAIGLYSGYLEHSVLPAKETFSSFAGT